MKAADGRGWREGLAAHGAQREALLFEGQSHSFEDLAREIPLLDASLEAAGVRAGDRVGLLAPPSKAGFVLIHALLDRGVVMVPLNLRWTAQELRYAVETAAAEQVIVADETARLGAALAELSGCGLLTLGEASPGRTRLSVLREEMTRVAERRDRRPVTTRREALCAGDAALILFTSGTSGRPRGALLSGANLRASAAGSIALLGSEPDDRWLCCMPLFHIGGLSILIRSALAATAVALHTGFEAAAVDRALEADGITRVSFVATMLERLLEARGETRAPQRLRLVLLGGGPASRRLLERAERLGYPVAPTYGLTEAASQVATRPPGARIEPGTDRAGGLEPLPGTEIRIVAEGRACVDAGVPGEIEIRGPTLMQGYFGDAEATARVLHDGWLSTGDLGCLDAAGRLRILDRRSDLIVSGGENVYPAEVESVLVEHPDVVEAGVVGIEDAVYGMRPRAFLVARPGRDIDTETIRLFCRERLAGYKVPVEVIQLDALPRTATGKLLRRELQEWKPRVQ